MKKKRLLKLLIALTVVVVMVVLSSTVFTLKNVELCFYDSKNNLIEDYSTLDYFGDEDVQDIIDSGDFGFGKNIFFLQRQDNIDRIEKEHPYIKVIGISATFPDGFKIKAVERKPMYSVYLSTGKYAICDKELKVLEVVDTISNKYKYIALANLGIDDQEAGNFIKGNNDIDRLARLGSEFSANKYGRTSAIKYFESIRMYEGYFTEDKTRKCTWLSIQTRPTNEDDSQCAGVRIDIENISTNFEEKINKALSIFNYYFSSTEPDQYSKSLYGVIKVYDNCQGAWVDTIERIDEEEV